MDLILLDNDFNICGIVEKYSCLKWNRRYFDVGNFTLRLSPDYFENLRAARYIYHSINDETAVIENINYDLDENGRYCLYASGRMLESLLSDRVIDSVTMLEGGIEEAVFGLVSALAMQGDRKIDLLELASPEGFPYTVSMQVTGRNLMDFIYSFLKTYGLSFSMHYDYLENKIVFGIFEGLDRSRSQSQNSVAVFSSDFENIRSDKYVFDISEYKNFAYVAGEGTGNSRIVTTVNNVPDGETRKELYVDARDVRKTLDNGTVLSDSEYIALLQSRGTQRLHEKSRIDYAECKIDSESNMIYRYDYDVGDICDFDDRDIGISSSLRITGLHETWSDGSMTADAVFQRV